MKHLKYLVVALGLLIWSQANAATCFWVGGTGTWNNSTDATHWSSSTGGSGSTCAATGGFPKNAGDVATFDGASGGGTVTNNVDISIGQITMGAFTGTLDFATNNHNVTLTAIFSNSGTGTRTLNMGSGTWTLSVNNGTAWDQTTSTNLTLNAGSSTILVSATPAFNRTLNLGSTTLTYGTITLVSTGAKSYNTALTATANMTIGTLNITAPNSVAFNSAVTYTITNAFTWAGTAFNNAILLLPGNGVTPTIAAAAGSTIAWGAIGSITFTGSPTASNSFDLKGSSGITITGPTGGATVVGIIGGGL